eukprot:GHVU01121546.1.p1 GENE.GHVU01121546.1~~GHVU01121546.1.p1  ORF type:complete len:244 (-),score=41.96 GHVU01121546.1:2917-3648(-)
MMQLSSQLAKFLKPLRGGFSLIASKTSRTNWQAVKAVAHRNERHFASAASVPNLQELLKGELQHETSNYEAPTTANDFLTSNGWSLEDSDGNVNMVLKKEIGGKKVMVEYQLVSPFSGGAEPEADEESDEAPPSETEFSVTIKNNSNEGMTFYCSTIQNDEKFRYTIGNLRYFSSEEEKVDVSAYNGPEFEDLDEGLQQALDGYLSSYGVDEALCDFIDTMALDKEQREYIRWLSGVSKFVHA